MPKTLPTGWHFARPKLADHYLRSFDLGLISATALYARRRMGKTEFLTKDLMPAARAKGYVVGYCNLWQEEQQPAEAIAEAIIATAQPRRLLAKVRAKINSPVSTLKLSGKVGVMAEGTAELGLKDTDKQIASRLRSAFTAFDESGNKGLVLIDEAQVLADKSHRSLEKALRALLDTRKDRLQVIFDLVGAINILRQRVSNQFGNGEIG